MHVGAGVFMPVAKLFLFPPAPGSLRRTPPLFSCKRNSASVASGEWRDHFFAFCLLASGYRQLAIGNRLQNR